MTGMQGAFGSLAARLPVWLGHPRLPLALTGLALLLTLPALWTGWQSDDYLHQLALRRPPEYRELLPPPLLLFSFVDGDPPHTRRLVDAGWLPWWTFDGLRLAFCRPLTALTHWLDYQLWPRWPVIMHAHSLLWFAVLVYAATLLYRGVMGKTWVAGLAALFYAIDDAHGFPVGWVANRNAVIAAALGVLALVAHDRWRTRGWRVGAVLGPVALLFGLLAGEVTVGAGAYLLAHALFLDRAAWPRRVAALGPYAVVAGGWWLLYHRLGFGASGSSWYIDPVRDPLDFAAAVLERGPILLLGQWGLPAADLYLVLSASAARLHWLVAVLSLVVLAVALAPLVWRDRTARFWAMGMLLSLVPVCTTVPFDRLLFLVGLGAMGLVARFIAGVAGHAGSSGARPPERSPAWVPAHRWWLGLARGLLPFLIAVHGVIAPLVLPARACAPALLGRFVARCGALLPSDPLVQRQDVVVVNAPSALITGLYVPASQTLLGQPSPARVRVLTAGLSEVELTRTDAHTLVVRPAGGFAARPGVAAGRGAPRPAWFRLKYMLQHLDRLVCDDQHGFAVGQRVELTGLTIEVTTLTPDGRPAAAAFRFALPLEAPSLRWLQWHAGGYAPFPLPAIGETVRLAAASARS